MVTRHRCYSACPYPHPFAPLIPFGLRSWMKGFQIFNFSCVSSKEGTVLVWLIFKGKIRKRGKEEWTHGRTWAGSHAEEGQLAGGLGNEIKPETTPHLVILEQSPESVVSLTHEDQENQGNVTSTNHILLTADHVPATQPSSYKHHPIHAYTHPTQGLIITV